ncbi:MAG: xanthine dehydrogenase family protein subunit M [Deltaproteobacteria bacterium]|nr:xanthine dehydrogenase family protein subunit M [Deltaproteobacteria bacterium]
MAVFYRRLPRFRYTAPGTLEEALGLLNDQKGATRLLAGGTDLIPQLKRRGTVLPETVVDLKGIPGLAAVSYDERSGLRIGALTTINTVSRTPVIQKRFSILAQAAATMASPQVRNRGTFAGNICTAVPSADSAPALLSLEAQVRLRGAGGERIVPLDGFFIGPRRTVAEPDEILQSILVPSPEEGCRGIYLKLSPRHSMDLAIVGVAATGVAEAGSCKKICLALGAVAPTPIRARQAEVILTGQRLNPEVIEAAARMAMEECRPIDDHRASADYRRDMVYMLTRRAINQIFPSV